MATEPSRLLRVWHAVWPHLSGRRARERKWRPQTYILASRRDTVWNVALRNDPAVVSFLQSCHDAPDDAPERTVVIARSVYPSGDPALKVTTTTGEMLGYIADEHMAEVAELLRVYEVSRLRYHMLRELRFRTQLHAMEGDDTQAELWVQEPLKLTEAYWVKDPLPSRNSGF